MHDHPNSLVVVIGPRFIIGNHFRQLGMSCHAMKQENAPRNTANHALIEKGGEGSAPL